ncbi:MAG: alpha/beta hydrolase [Lachnospiraceae bacterium]|nr:alpha/beta hydrolase [Lachnospiraceae bacterium]
MKRKKGIKMISCIVLLGIVILVMIILPPSTGKSKPFLDNNENILKGSISEKCYLKANDTTLGMFIMAKDETKPVLLICGGGPGIPEYLLEQFYPTGLENEFVVCYLEYRGTGLSYDSSIDPDTVTTEQYVEDIIAVTNYLRERFKQKKLYLLGHSYGTSVGIKAAQKNPELYHAYIAMSQMCNQPESEKRAYEYMKEQYSLAGNTKMVKQFENYEQYKSNLILRDKAMHDLGVGTTRDMNSIITGLVLPSLRCKAYSPLERINIWRGKISSNRFKAEMDKFNFNAFEEVPSMDIPIYFLAGVNDYTCCYSLQKEYYEYIKAPVKKFYSFDYSAHSPLFEESDKAISILKEDVLNSLGYSK